MFTCILYLAISLYLSYYCLYVNVQASCADDKEQWVQLLQDGSSSYQHTSHESLRYTHSRSHAVWLSVCCQHSIWTEHESLNHTHTLTHRSIHILSASSFHSSVSSVPQWSEKPQVSHLKHVHGRPLSAALWSISPPAAHLFELIHTGAHGMAHWGGIECNIKYW